MTVIGIMSALHEELAAVLADMPDEQRVVVAGLTSGWVTGKAMRSWRCSRALAKWRRPPPPR
jgi:hypothetical protein